MNCNNAVKVASTDGNSKDAGKVTSSDANLECTEISGTGCYFGLSSACIMYLLPEYWSELNTVAPVLKF